MPHIPRTQSITNRHNAGGPKKAGKPDHSNWSRIPFRIFKSKTPTTLFLFSQSGYVEYVTEYGDKESEGSDRYAQWRIGSGSTGTYGGGGGY
jgi:hypothetical protein